MKSFIGKSSASACAVLSLLFLNGCGAGIAGLILALSSNSDGGSTTYVAPVPPFVELLPIEPAQLSSGVIPIRYRVFDQNLDPASISIEVATDDGLGFREALEFPAAGSQGLSEIATLPAEEFGDPDRPYRTFLWDALAQFGGRPIVSIACQARDKETGPRTLLGGMDLSLACLESAGELPAGEALTSLIQGDFDGDGFPDLVAANRFSNDITCYRGGAGGLTRTGEIPMGTRPETIDCGDYDGDGFLDLVVGNTDSNTITYLRGGEEGPTIAKDIAVGVASSYWNCPHFLDSKDFDGDGFLDVVTNNIELHSLSYMRGGKDGLSDALEIPGIRYAGGMMDDDFDKDGYLDLLVMHWSNASSVSYLRGGAEGPHLVGEISTGFVLNGLDRGDFNGDGFPDVVVEGDGADGSPGHLLCLHGGASGLTPEASLQLETGTIIPYANDFDGDGFCDVFLINMTLSTLTQFQGGTQGLTLAGEMSVGHEPWGLDWGDYDGDGFLDIVVVNSGSHTISYLRGGPEGLRPAGEIPTGYSPESTATADFNGDGYPDLAIGNYVSKSVTFLRGGPEGLIRMSDLPAGSGISWLEVGDFNGDGLLDIVTENDNSDDITCLMGKTGGLRVVGDLPVGMTPVDVTCGDYDKDGYTDAVVVNYDSESVTFLRGGVGGLGVVEEIPVGSEPYSLESADFDQDGFEDVLVLSPYEPLCWFKGSKGGLGSAIEIQGDLGGADCLAVGDFNGDGYPDVAAAGFYEISYFLGGPGGVAPGGSILSEGSIFWSIVSVDFDADGLDDVAASDSISSKIVVLHGTPEGLASSEDIPAGEMPSDLAAADFDGDGYADLVVESWEGLSIHRGSAEGLISTGEAIDDARALVLAAGDFNADGFPDVVRANGNDEYATFFAGGPAGLTLATETYSPGWPWAMTVGDFDSDGFSDVIARSEENYFILLRGGADGLRAGGQIKGHDPGTTLYYNLATGDFDGDGFTDLLAANEDSASATQLRQIFIQPHVNSIVDPDLIGHDGIELSEPRLPPRFRLELPPGSLRSATQVCMLPGPPFELPQGEAYSRGRYLNIVTDPVTILRETTELPAAKAGARAILTLRLRDNDPELLQEALHAKTSRLRVFRKDLATGKAVDAGVSAKEIRISDLDKGSGVSFPIRRFGSYVVALERDRPR